MTPCPAIALLTWGLVCSAQIDRIIDGDTAYMTFGGSVSHSVRIVGIDTPERGEHGFQEATEAARAAFEAKTVVLTIGGAEGRREGRCVGRAVLDRFGRVLAAVDGWEAVLEPWAGEPWCR